MRRSSYSPLPLQPWAIVLAAALLAGGCRGGDSKSLSIAEVSYENGVITSTELNDARLSLLETGWELMQAKYAQIVAAARTRYAAGL